ncbi:MAG: LCCL domain-containing protein [Pseudomonadota bacterium]
MPGLNEQRAWSARALNHISLTSAALAACFGLALAVPVPSGPLASVAHAAKGPPKSCGNRGQRPCKAWVYLPGCGKGLSVKLGQKTCTPTKPIINLPPVKKPTRPANCGREGQKPCLPSPFYTTCVGKLVQDFSINRCRQSNGSIIDKSTQAFTKSARFLGNTYKKMVECNVAPLFRNGKNHRTNSKLQQLLSKSCVGETLRQARRLGFQTVTFGGGGGVSCLIGAEGENGFAIETKAPYRVSTYHTLAVKGGLTCGGGAGMFIGLWKGHNGPGRGSIDGDGHGATVAAKVLGGGGGGGWYGYDGKFAGVNAMFGAGVKIDVAYVRNTTKLVPLAKTYRNAWNRPANNPNGVANCPANATNWLRVGASGTCYCPASATRQGRVWGSYYYTADSKICRAAIHDGAIGTGGGVVTIIAQNGRSSYKSATYNGVTTSRYGAWNKSFIFKR